MLTRTRKTIITKYSVKQANSQVVQKNGISLNKQSRGISDSTVVDIFNENYDALKMLADS